MRLRSLRPPRRLGHGEEATLVEHLEELRHRLFVCIGAVAVGFVVAFIFHRHLIHALELELPKNRRHLTTLTIGEPFMTSMWLSVYAGFLLALPVVIWQAWSFFLPAFDPAHERVLRVFVVISVALLAIGVAFGYEIALPAAAHFLTNYDKNQYTVLIRARDYIGFAAKVLVAMAIVFELPLFVVGLTRIGILQTRTLRRSRRIGYFVVCCVGVALPGVDPVTTTLETIPLLVLYEASIWASVLLERRSERTASAPLEPQH
ncbi:MAG TPA: twin-arginine translocase subunit TatC [Gaiellaceae bacterium]|nr:twin-arginine translocase subunit TatC [Gaiellaceae bacterium]